MRENSTPSSFDLTGSVGTGCFEDRPVKVQWKRTLWLAGGFLAVLAFCFAIDEKAFAFVHTHWNYNTHPIPDYLKLPTRIMRSMEDWGENVYIFCVLYAMWQFDRHRRSRIVLLIASAILVTLPVEGIKRIAGRERPELNGGQSVFHGPAKFDGGGDFQSFPSGHAASSASYSGSLAAFYPPMKPVVIALAVGCAGNRIWKERHFFSDCWAGGAMGFWLAYTLPRRRWVRRFCDQFDRRFSVPVPSSPLPLARAA